MYTGTYAVAVIKSLINSKRTEEFLDDLKL